MGRRARILLASDIHLCHIDWYGTKNDKQVEKCVADIEAECRREGADALLLLGDYSLDHWAWHVKGCWLNDGVSNTARFVRTYMERLRAACGEIRMIAGNHEQYGDALWQEQTGFARKDHLLCGGVLFILLDTFGADLDPVCHSDGTYCGADVLYIREKMAQYPDMPVILCAHHFAPEKESEEFCALVRGRSASSACSAGMYTARRCGSPRSSAQRPCSGRGTIPTPARSRIRWSAAAVCAS